MFVALVKCRDGEPLAQLSNLPLVQLLAGAGDDDRFLSVLTQ
jgi:hypothetical protein